MKNETEGAYSPTAVQNPRLATGPRPTVDAIKYFAWIKPGVSNIDYIWRRSQPPPVRIA